MTRREYPAVTAAPGVALGPAHVRRRHAGSSAPQRVAADRIDAEIHRLQQATQAVRTELQDLRRKLAGPLAHEIGEFLDLHALLLDDPELLSGLTDLIRRGHYSAEHALHLQRARIGALFEAMEDPYLRSRREDIEQVITRVQERLLPDEPAATSPLEGAVLVAAQPSPAELARAAQAGAAALVVASGSALSHNAILARNLGLPMLIIPAEALAGIEAGCPLLVDAIGGCLVLEPDARDRRRARQLQARLETDRRALYRLRHAPTRTRDGADILLQANAQTGEEIAEAVRCQADGIGLFRTEFLFSDAALQAQEDEQFAIFRAAVLAMEGRPVTLRTFDLGADKPDLAAPEPDLVEPNPALGLRGIRRSLQRPARLRTQLRAMLRAAACGPVRILLPMVSAPEEIGRVRALLRSCQRELAAEGVRPRQAVPLGAMIEVPAAALDIANFLPHLDFASIGSNDLIQYLLAADRANPGLGELYSPLHPVVIRVLHGLANSFAMAGKPLSICGEMAADPHYTRLLLALGIRDLSMRPARLLEIRALVRDSHWGNLRRRCGALLRAGSRASLERALDRL